MTLSIVFTTLAVALASPTQAEPRINAAQAASIAQQRYVGEVIDVDLDDAKPREPAGLVYEVKLLSASGDVIRVRVAAESGDYLGADGPDLARVAKPPSAGKVSR